MSAYRQIFFIIFRLFICLLDHSVSCSQIWTSSFTLLINFWDSTHKTNFEFHFVWVHSVKNVGIHIWLFSISYTILKSISRAFLQGFSNFFFLIYTPKMRKSSKRLLSCFGNLFEVEPIFICSWFFVLSRKHTYIILTNFFQFIFSFLLFTFKIIFIISHPHATQPPDYHSWVVLWLDRGILNKAMH